MVGRYTPPGPWHTDHTHNERYRTYVVWLAGRHQIDASAIQTQRYEI